MHECPDCGQACDCDGDDVWMDYPYNLNCRHTCEDDYDDDDHYERYHELDACIDCGSPHVVDGCQCCGGWLCVEHSEAGAGFCRKCPTQEWIDEQAQTLA